MSIIVPVEGRQTQPTSSDDLLSLDGNAFVIIGAVQRTLRRAGASAEFCKAFVAEATSGEYDHLLQTSIAYLDAEPRR